MKGTDVAIIQLVDGAQVPVPASRLRARLMCSANAELGLARADAPGQQIAPVTRISRVELIVDAVEGVTIVISPAEGLAFPVGATAELTISGAGAAPDEVRRTVDVGGRRQVVLAQFGDGVLRADGAGPARSADPALAPATAQPWHEAGREAYYAVDRHDAAGGRKWAAVIDCSASMLARMPQIDKVLEIVFGAAVTSARTAPVSVLAPSGSGLRETAPLLDNRSVAWTEVLGVVPSPWARLAPAVRQAAATVGFDGEVLVVCDGAPADTTELLDVVEGAPVARLHVLALGRSAMDALPEDRPTSWWDDELDALTALAQRGHVVVSLQRQTLDTASAGRLIAALYPEARA